MGNKGNQNLKEVVLLGAALSNVAGEVLEDGKVNLADVKSLPLLLSALGKIKPAIDDIGEVPSEMADLDDGEYQDIVNAMKEHFELSDDQLEEKIEKWFSLGLAVVESL